MRHLASPSLEPEYLDEAVALGEYDRVVILVWRGAPTRARLERVVQGFGDIAARVSGRVSMLAVIEATSPAPRLEDLVFSATAFDRYAAVTAATAAVLEDRATTSVILDATAQVNSLRRRPTPSKFCADVREAVAWLAIRHPHESSDRAFRDGVLEAVEALRARLRG